MKRAEIISCGTREEAVHRLREDASFLASLSDVCESYSLVSGSDVVLAVLVPVGEETILQEHIGSFSGIEILYTQDPMEVIEENLFSAVVYSGAPDAEEAAEAFLQRILSRFHNTHSELRRGNVYTYG